MWHWDKHKVCDLVLIYLMELFHSNQPSSIEVILDALEPKLTEEDNVKLLEQFSE